MKPISEILDEITARADATSPAPWFAEECGDFGSKSHIIADILREQYGNNALDCGEDKQTADFIAAARQDVPKLIEALRRAMIHIVGNGTERGILETQKAIESILAK